MANKHETEGKKGPGQPIPDSGQLIQDDTAEEDIAEGKDRMMDEGGGVVEHHTSEDTPVSRNDLVQPSSV